MHVVHKLDHLQPRHSSLHDTLTHYRLEYYYSSKFSRGTVIASSQFFSEPYGVHSGWLPCYLVADLVETTFVVITHY